MSMISIHEYIKNHYEKGDYNDFSNAYSDSESDYDFGYQKATHDYIKNKRFRWYPYFLISLINILTGNRLIEIVNFLKGYKDKVRDNKR